MKRLVLIVTGVIFLGALLVGPVRARIYPQGPPEFAGIALDPREFPIEWQPFQSAEGIARPDDQRHPLNRLNPLVGETEQKEIGGFLYNYTGYYQEFLIWDGQFSGLVGNYLYQYPSEDQAQRVAQALIASSQHYGPAVYEIPEGKQVKGWAARFRGEKGGDVHWFVGTRGNVLILLVVDGPAGCCQEGFLQLVERLLAR
ncbi:MAG: hypothetical protein ACP5N6_15545 [Anaerolineae bacterium]